MGNLVNRKCFNFKIFSIAIIFSSIGVLCFLQFINTLGDLWASDINYKMLSFYTGRAYSDAFDPGLASINGSYQSVLGAIFSVNKLIPIHPAYVTGIYLGICFIPYILYSILSISIRPYVYVSIVIFIASVNLPGYDSWFYYHLDKYFSLYCIFLTSFFTNYRSKLNLFFRILLVFSALIAYVNCGLILLAVVLAGVRAVDLNKFTIRHVEISVIVGYLIFAKFLVIGETTYLGYDPMGGDYTVFSIINYIYVILFRIVLDQILYSFVGILFFYLLLRVISAHYFYRSLLKGWYSSARLTACVIAVTVPCVFLKVNGVSVPLWQMLEYFFVPCIVINIIFVFMLFLDRVYRYFFKIEYCKKFIYRYAACFLMVYLVVGKSLILGAINHGDYNKVLVQFNDFITKSVALHKCTNTSVDFGSYGSVVLRTYFGIDYLQPWNVGFVNPKWIDKSPIKMNECKILGAN